MARIMRQIDAFYIVPHVAALRLDIPTSREKYFSLFRGGSKCENEARIWGPNFGQTIFCVLVLKLGFWPIFGEADQIRNL